jgi:hypothetical protein
MPRNCFRTVHPDDRPLILTIRSLVKCTNLHIKAQGTESKTFEATTGVPQGSVISPTLFTRFIDTLVADIEKTSAAPFMVGNVRSNCLLYADDIALLAHNVEELQLLLDACYAFSKRSGLLFSTAKCVTLNVPEGSENHLNHVRLEKVDSFKYVGIWFNKKGIDPKTSISAAEKKVWFTLHNASMAGITSLDFDTKIRFYYVFIRPILEFGLAIVPYKRREMKKLEKLQSTALRYLLRQRKSCSADALRAICRIPQMYHRQQNLREGFLLHLENCPEDVLSKVS